MVQCTFQGKSNFNEMLKSMNVSNLYSCRLVAVFVQIVAVRIWLFNSKKVGEQVSGWKLFVTNQDLFPSRNDRVAKIIGKKTGSCW